MRVLWVDDDKDFINNCMAEIDKDYIVDVAYTASEGAYMSSVNDYDVIVVDSNLPDNDGCFLCKDVRDANISAPILFLSETEDSSLRVKSLKDGANVCLSKASSPVELKAQIRALLRLRHAYCGANYINIKHLKIDLLRKEIKCNDLEINLRRREFSVLEYLIINRGRIVSKEELLDHVWEEGILTRSNSLEVHIRNLRLKIEKPFGCAVIKTVRGFGYKID